MRVSRIFGVTTLVSALTLILTYAVTEEAYWLKVSEWVVYVSSIVLYCAFDLWETYGRKRNDENIQK